VQYKISPHIDFLLNNDESQAILFNKQTKKEHIFKRNAINFVKQFIDYKSVDLLSSEEKAVLGKLKELNIITNEFSNKNCNLRKIRFVQPLTRLQIEVTQNCNLRCAHCYLSETSEYKFKLDKKEIFNIIDQAYTLGVREINITGGEALVHSDIAEILKYISELGLKLRLFTNATMLNEKFIDSLKLINLDYLKISLDGVSKETLNSIRGKGVFERIIPKLYALKQSGIKVEITTVVMKQNISEMEEIISFVKEEITSRHFIDTFIPIFNSDDDYSLLINEKEFVKSISSVLDNMKLIKNNHVSSYCGFGEDYLYINSEGNIQLCPMLTKVDNYKTYNIKNSTLEYIWNDICETRKPQCSYFDHCKYAGYCGGGCRSRGFYTSKGDINARDLYMCEMYKYLESKGKLYELNTTR